MTNTETPTQPRWFFVFIVLFTGLQLIWLGFLVVDFILYPIAPDPQFGSGALRLLIGAVIVPLALIVAVLVLRRAKGNVTGWFLLMWITTIMGGTLRPDSPLSPYLASNVGWLGLWLLPLYFPNGRAFPLRFERLTRLLTVQLLIIVRFWTLVQPTIGVVEGARQLEVANPLFISALVPLQPLVNLLEAVLLGATALLILPSLILRYRASDFTTRRQMKWLGWVFALLFVLAIPLMLTGLMTDNPYRYGTPGLIAVFAFEGYLYLAPYLAVGNAILHHRLYDIDIIIRRTLIYSILTAILAAIYFGGVVLAQSVLRPLTASSDLAIVLSTLGIAALFNPLRHRIQNTIDRRFFRRKYNAERTLEAFSLAVRDEVDLDVLQAALVGVVQETMQPTKVSLWLKE